MSVCPFGATMPQIVIHTYFYLFIYNKTEGLLRRQLKLIRLEIYRTQIHTSQQCVRGFVFGYTHYLIMTYTYSQQEAGTTKQHSGAPFIISVWFHATSHTKFHHLGALWEPSNTLIIEITPTDTGTDIGVSRLVMDLIFSFPSICGLPDWYLLAVKTF